MTYLSVKFLEGVLAGEEVQVDVQDVRLSLTQQRRDFAHDVTRGSFFIGRCAARRTANLCWQQSARTGEEGLGTSSSPPSVLCARPLGTARLRVPL